MADEPRESQQLLLEGLKRLAINAAAGSVLLRQRSEEIAQVRGFVESCVRERRGGFAYVCGPVGCGKSAAVCGELCREWQEDGGLRVTTLNCVSQSDTPVSLASRVLSSLPKKRAPAERGEDDFRIFVLDEMDDMATYRTGWKALAQLLQRTAEPEPPYLVLIGVGNDLDFLSKAEAKDAVPRVGADPELVTFPAYEQRQIEEALGEKIGDLGVYDPQVLTWFAQQTRKSRWDLRAAFTLAREPLLREWIEQKRAKEGTGGRTNKLPLTLQVVYPMVSDMVEDVKVMVSKLPVHQQLFLCAVMILENSQYGGRDGQAGRLAIHREYVKLCEACHGIQPLTICVLFQECIGSLTDLGFIEDNGRATKLAVEPEDVVAGLRDLSSLRNYLEARQRALGPRPMSP